MAVATEYLEARVMTAPKHMLHLMVVDGAIRFAKVALEGLGRNDFEASHVGLNRSRACVNEMLLRLDPSSSPAVIEQLKELFLFVHRQLVEADLLHKPQCILDAIKILEIHRETWTELIQVLPHAVAQQEPAPQHQPAAPHAFGELETSSRSWTT